MEIFFTLTYCLTVIWLAIYVIRFFAKRLDHYLYGYSYLVVYGRRQDGNFYYCSRHYISDTRIDTFKDLEKVDKRITELDGESDIVILNILPLENSTYED